MTAILPTALSGTQSNGTDRPDLLSDPTLSGSERDPQRWFNSAAFREPQVYFDAFGAFSVPGNEGRNVITGPGLMNWDLSLQRHVRLSERTNLVFRADCFNLTNHPNLAPPSTSLFNGTGGRQGAAGTIDGTLSTMRQNSFALKFIF